jgi:RND family efflux transporter MFP subunit
MNPAMSETNGTATLNRISGVLPTSNGNAFERAGRNGHEPGRQHVEREGRTVSSFGPGSRGRRVAAGVAAVVVVLVAGVGVAVMANSNSDAEAPATPRILAVRTISVEPVNAYQTAREYTGAIVARRTSQLGFELAGKLEAIHFDEGDSITAATALAKLDTEHLETNRRKIAARRAQAAAKLDEMVTGPRDEDIAAARARVASFDAQVELLKRQTARQKSLAASRASSQDEYEQYAFGLKAREAQLDEARHNLEELLNGTRTEQIVAQRAVVVELDATIADIDVDLRKSTLTAPFDGTIARRLADDGTVVDAGQPVFRLVEDQALEAWIGLPVRATEPLAEGSVQRVKIAGRYFEATVAGRFPEVDPATRTRTVVLRLDDSAAAHVVHGQVVRLQLEETVEANGYWLPSTALTQGARGLWTSFVAAEADPKDSTQPELFRVERRDVEVLHTESDRVLVRGTLRSGDRVITSGTHRVVPGQSIRLAK